MDPVKDSAEPVERATATTDGPSNGAQPQSTEGPVGQGRRGSGSSQTLQRRPSIRLQRLPSTQAVPTLSTVPDDETTGHELQSTRRRSSSEPQRPVASGALGAELVRAVTQTARMAPVAEEAGNQVPQMAQGCPPESSKNVKSKLRSASVSARSMLNRPEAGQPEPALADGEYAAGIVNLLDVVGEPSNPGYLPTHHLLILV